MQKYIFNPISKQFPKKQSNVFIEIKAKKEAKMSVIDHKDIRLDSQKFINETESSKISNDNSVNNYSIHRSIRSKHLIDEHVFKEIMQKHRISSFFAKKLKNLNTFKIVFILDDSGSMNTVLDESPLNKNQFKATRWDELQEFIKISIEIANTVNPEGCDVYFLNRRMVKSVKKPEEITSSFKRSPSGFTPITKRLTTVLRSNMPNVLNDKKLLVVIVTDGEPTSPEGI